jgi:glycosyltransferase involved in cell wall biosynthesis
MNKPLVSICCITYNHAKYVRECLDGFLMQKTTFEYEIIMHDDASTDETQEIINSYCRKHPNLFRTVYQQFNLYAKGIRGIAANYVYPLAKGKYIAVCEGDDYWTDPYKLQKQVDFMEDNPDVNFSMGRVQFLYQQTGEFKPKKEFVKPGSKGLFSVKDYLKQPFSHTSTFLFRNNYLPAPEWVSEVLAGDQTSVIIMTGANGKIKFHDETFSVYRVNQSSITQTNLLGMLKNNIQTFNYWNQYLDYKYNGLIKSRILENYIVYYMFKPRFVRKLYKSHWMESTLQFFYHIVMSFKNTLAKS